MLVPYRVLLPKWVFNSNDTQQIELNIKRYLQRYPEYSFVHEEDGFAICSLWKGVVSNKRK